MSFRLEGDAGAEWRQHGLVVLAASAGMAASAMHSYSLGLFIAPLQQQFGWTRAQIASGPMIAAIAAVILSPGIGHLVDRLGSRRPGIVATTCLCLAMAMLGLSGPSIWSWRALWLIQATAIVMIQPTIWTSAVTRLFSAGRGMALAVTLCGSGVSSIVTPWLAYSLIERLGWRLAFPAIGAFWAVVTLPLLILFLKGSGDRAGGPRAPMHLEPLPYRLRQVFRQRGFPLLALATLLFAGVIVSLAVSLVPIISASGIPRYKAAAIASLLGFASIAGRLTIGLLLDRVEARWLAVATLCLPVASVMVLLAAPGSTSGATLAVLVLGLAMGAELDILAYICSRYFPLRYFGLVFGTIGGIVTLAGGSGPALLNAVYDATGAYTRDLQAVIPICILTAFLFASLGRYPANHERSLPDAQDLEAQTLMPT